MIIFKNVTKQFNDSFALKDVSFSVDPGELLTVTGHSGSGKTTLMRLLIKEYTPSTGEIIFDSTPLHSIRSGRIHHHRRNIGVVFQDYKLLPEMNVWENIALALSIVGTRNNEIERRVTDLLELVSLTNKAFLFPAQLSGGEAQRVSIARALSTAPKVIFADEPTGNLDSESSEHIIKLLKKINSMGTTVMVTTHNHDVQEWLSSSRHIHLQNGMLISDSKKASADSSKNTNTEKNKDTTTTETTHKKSFWSWLPWQSKSSTKTAEPKPKVSSNQKKEEDEETTVTVESI